MSGVSQVGMLGSFPGVVGLHALPGALVTVLPRSGTTSVQPPDLGDEVGEEKCDAR